MEAITKKWYDYLEEGKLMGLKCKRCGTVHFPPYPICRECSGMEMEWTEIEGTAMAEQIVLVSAPDQWFAEYAPYYFVYAITAEGSAFDSMLLGLECEPDEVLEKIRGKLPFKVKMEIQKRDGYSYPVYRYLGE